jgi:fatty-acyl-CoA synthase
VGQPQLSTVAELLVARRDDARVGLRFEDASWSFAAYVEECERRAAYLVDRLDRDREPHFGVLLENVPDYCFWLGAAALAGATLVGVNPTRRGAELARDITHTECQFIVSDETYAEMLDQIDVPVMRVEEELPALSFTMRDVDPATRLLLLFTSGTTAAPKAVICSQGRLARIAAFMTDRFSLTADDVCYCAMPMFHGNAIMTSWAPALAAGATLALRRKFSASGFLPDIRTYGATYFNYVGRPLAYILATPEQPDDADNPLRRVFGNEASEPDMRAFERRFGCVVQEGYGSSEGGASINRTPDTPPAALGPAPPGVVILNDAGDECVVATFDEHGRLRNADAAVGEIVNRDGAAGFEGYWRNEEATAARVSGSAYRTGDLGYRDADGYIYFAGRSDDWLRVDGENVAVAPIETILSRHPAIAGAAVYGVPDPQVGDLVMAAIELREGAAFDAEEFVAFLAAQPDLGTKMSPRFVRIVDEIPLTPTMKPVRRGLRRQAWLCTDPVWWRRSASDREFIRLTDVDITDLAGAFEAHGRRAHWPAP